MNDSLTARMLAASKKQIIGQIALAQENRSGLMLSIGKSLLHFDKVDSYEETYADVEEITSSDLQEAAQNVFASRNISSLAYFPEN